MNESVNKPIFRKYQIANYVCQKHFEMKGRTISPLKLQKSLYLLFAEWAGFIETAHRFPNWIEIDFSGKSNLLFNANFRAWAYGPVDQAIYNSFTDEKVAKKTKVKDIFDTEDKLYAKEFIDDLLSDLFDVSDFKLVEICRNDECWKKNYNVDDEFHNKKIKKQDIIENYVISNR